MSRPKSRKIKGKTVAVKIKSGDDWYALHLSATDGEMKFRHFGRGVGLMQWKQGGIVKDFLVPAE